MGLALPKAYRIAGRSIHRWYYLLFIGVVGSVAVGGSIFSASLQYASATESAFPTRQFSGSIGTRAAVNWGYGAVTRDSSGDFLAIEQTSVITVTRGGETDYQIKKLSPDGSYLATYAQFSAGSGDGQFGGNAYGGPYDITTDHNDNIIVADTANSRIEVFSKNGQFVRTIGSSGSAAGQLSGPRGVAVDSQNDIYVADTGNNRVEKYDQNGNFLATIGGAGTTTGTFSSPQRVYVDNGDNLYVTQSGNGGYAQKFTSGGVYAAQYVVPNGGIWCTGRVVAGIGVASDGTVYTMSGGSLCTPIVTFQPDGTYIGMSNNGIFNEMGPWVLRMYGDTFYGPFSDGTIREFSLTGTQIGATPTTVTSPGVLNGNYYDPPQGIAQDSAGDTYVVDNSNSRVQEFAPDGTFSRQFGSSGTGNGQFSNPMGVFVSHEGFVYVSDRTRMQKFTTDGTFVSSMDIIQGQSNSAPVGSAIAEDSHGTMYVVGGNGHIMEFSQSDAYLGQFGTYGSSYQQMPVNGVGQGLLAIDGNDNVYVINSSYGVNKYDSNGNFLYQLPLPSARFTTIESIAVDSYNNLYELVTDTQTSAAVETASTIQNGYIAYSPSGKQITSYFAYGDDGGFIAPQSIYIGANNDMYITDANDYVQKFSVTGLAHLPGSPLNMSVTPSKGTAQITWQAPDDGGLPITEYDVSFKPHNSSTWQPPVILPTTARSFSAINLLNGDYDFSVVAVNGLGNSTAATKTSTIIYPYSYLKDMPAGSSTSPSAIAFAPDGTSYIADSWSSRVIKYAPDGTEVTTFGNYGTDGTDPGALNYPSDIAVGPNGDVYVTDWRLSYVQQYTANGTFIRQFDTSGAPEIGSAASLAIDSATGDVYVVDDYTGVQKYDANGNYLGTFAATDAQEPLSVATDAAGHVYIANYNDTTSTTVIDLLKYSSDGTLIKKASFPYSDGVGEMEELTSLAVDPNTGNIIGTDEYNARVEVFNPDLTFLNIIGSGWDNTTAIGVSDSNDGYMEFSDPLNVSFDPSGNVYISDDSNNRITVLSSTGDSSQPSATAPSVPENITASSPQQNTLHVTWDAPSDDGGSTITGYTVAIKPHDSSTWTTYNASASDREMTIVSVGQSLYDLEVTALNGVGGSAPAILANIAVTGSMSPRPSLQSASGIQAASSLIHTSPASGETAGEKQAMANSKKPQTYVNTQDGTASSGTAKASASETATSHAHGDGVVQTLLIALIVFVVGLILFLIVRRPRSKR